MKVQPDGSKEVKTRRINPGMPIPQESTAIHGIADDDVKDEPRFEQIAKSLAAYMEGCDFWRDTTPTVSIFRCWRKSSCVPEWMWI